MRRRKSTSQPLPWLDQAARAVTVGNSGYGDGTTTTAKKKRRKRRKKTIIPVSSRHWWVDWHWNDSYTALELINRRMGAPDGDADDRIVITLAEFAEWVTTTTTTSGSEKAEDGDEILKSLPGKLLVARPPATAPCTARAI